MKNITAFRLVTCFIALLITLSAPVVIFAAGEGAMPVAQEPPAAPVPAAVSPEKGASGQSRTPLTVNPDHIYRNQAISEDVTWRGEVLVEGVVSIAAQTTLTIEPGTVVRFRRTEDDGGVNPLLFIQGRIQAIGTPDRPILFSSAFAEPLAGDWQGIVIMSSGKKNLLEHCRIAGAETGVEAFFSTVTMKNVLFSGCGVGARLQDCLVVMTGGGASGCGVGLHILDSEADLRDMNFSANLQALVVEKSSLYLGGGTFYGNEQEALKADASRLRIIGNSFSANGNGAALSLCEGTVSANKILKNNGHGLLLVKSRLKVTGNEIARNGKNGLRVEDGKAVAWGNTITANGDYDIYNGGSEDFKAPGNWWGDVTPSAIGNRIYDRRNDAARGKVHYLPMLPSKPQPDI